MDTSATSDIFPGKYNPLLKRYDTFKNFESFDLLLLFGLNKVGVLTLNVVFFFPCGKEKTHKI